MDRTLYRVDRCQEVPIAPVGMNSLLYVGRSLQEATKVFNYIEGGKTEWGKLDPSYGVGLFMWQPNKNEYVVKRWKNK